MQILALTFLEVSQQFYIQPLFLLPLEVCRRNNHMIPETYFSVSIYDALEQQPRHRISLLVNQPNLCFNNHWLKFKIHSWFRCLLNSIIIDWTSCWICRQFVYTPVFVSAFPRVNALKSTWIVDSEVLQHMEKILSVQTPRLANFLRGILCLSHPNLIQTRNFNFAKLW